ncbi:alpha/beta fold hydrolase [Myxococcota bacterium]|nr:alpha/beta fold hydrolase [Myxococcota bacterium]
MTDVEGRSRWPREPAHEAHQFEGGELRIFVDRPKCPGRLPAVLFIQGFDGASMENLGDHPYGRFVQRLAAQGFAVFRAQWKGAGRAGGLPRHADADLETELRVFEAVLRRIRTYDFVDPDQVFLFGHSLGGLVAPLIAETIPVLGIAVYGTSLKPWRELIPEAFAFQLPYLGVDSEQTDRIVRDVADLMTLLYRDRKSPAEIARDERYAELLTEYMQYDGKGHLWGRHYRYWHQLDDHDMTEVWRGTGAFVLSMFGEFDFEVFSDLEARTIADLVNHDHPGHAEFLQIDGTSHLFCRVRSMQENVGDRRRRDTAESFNEAVVLETAAWMREVLARVP